MAPDARERAAEPFDQLAAEWHPNPLPSRAEIVSGVRSWSGYDYSFCLPSNARRYSPYIRLCNLIILMLTPAIRGGGLRVGTKSRAALRILCILTLKSIYESSFSLE